MPFDSIESVRQAMEKENYIADDLIATTVFLALRMKKPLLIEGEPGSGKSIGGDQPVLAITNNNTIRMPVESLFQELASNTPTKEGKDGWEYIELSNTYVPALAENAVRWSKASKLMRHNYQGKLLRIRTRSGRELTATPDHSFLIHGEFGPTFVTSSHLKVGLRTAVVRYVELPSSLRTLNMPEWIEEPTQTLGNRLGLVPHSRYVTGQVTIPSAIALDEKFGYFLGLFASEGTLNNRSMVSISTSSVLNKELTPLLKDMGLNTRSYWSPKSHYEELYFSSLAFNSFIRSVFGLKSAARGKGKWARVKRVPSFIYSASKEAKTAFLRGCFDGDGWVEEECVCLGTSSRDLADGIALLLSSLRIFCTIRYRRETDHYIITVRPADWLKIGFGDPEKQNRFTIAVGRKGNYQAIEVLPASEHILNVVKKAYSQANHSKALYMRTVSWVRKNLRRGGNIGLGTLRRMALQLDSAKLQKLADSDVLWDKIVSIEEIGHDGYVYDFEVPGPQTFTAGFGGVITHNTEIAKVLARMLDTELIRLQCYEGLDANMALYEWDYPRQMLRIRMGEASQSSKEEMESEIFSERYLLERPLLKAITHEGDRPAVLLIDEVDRAEEEFEGFLLEVLSDFQVTIPEIGTIASKSRPVVCLTSNESREIGDALKRRCLYLYIHHPTLEKEYKIIRTKVPDVPDRLAHQICSFMQEVRSLGFIKKPGIAETLDWASALLSLSEDELDLQTLQRTLSCIVKHKEDFKKVNGETLATILTEIKRKREVPARGK